MLRLHLPIDRMISAIGQQSGDNQEAITPADGSNKFDRFGVRSTLALRGVALRVDPSEATRRGDPPPIPLSDILSVLW